jgi:hypothetical protein
VAPESRITSPGNDTLFTGCPDVEINGTTDDCDNEVASVDVGINGFWYAACSADCSTWSYTFDPSDTDIYQITSRATDETGVMEEPGTGITVQIVNCNRSGGDDNPPPAPTLYAPGNGWQNVSRTPTLYWSKVSDASGVYRYQIQIDNDPADWADVITDAYSRNLQSPQYYQSSQLQNNHWFGWRVRAQDGAGNWGSWSAVWRFKTRN